MWVWTMTKCRTEDAAKGSFSILSESIEEILAQPSGLSRVRDLLTFSLIA